VRRRDPLKFSYGGKKNKVGTKLVEGEEPEKKLYSTEKGAPFFAISSGEKKRKETLRKLRKGGGREKVHKIGKEE